MEDIDALLAVYEPGEPKMKPEVLEQTKKIEEQRRQMVENHQKAQQSQNAILMKQEGKEPIPLTMQQIVELLQKQQNENEELKKKVEEQEEIIRQFQRIIIQPSVSGIPSAIQPASPSLAFPVKNKSDPEIHIDL
jgi:seryl-tRNA synthetase